MTTMFNISNLGTKGKIMVVVGSILIVAVVVITIRYNSAVHRAEERLKGYQQKSEIVETAYGKITYIDEGEGEIILSCHGICGGYDQAYDTLSDKVDSYRILAPSRFGYLESTIPQNPSVDKQVEAFVELLDAIGADKVYVLGTSAGGAVATRFALLHPERTKGLILYCSGYPAIEKPKKKATYVGPPSALCYDFPMWFFSPLFGPLMGMDSNTIEAIMPLNKRHGGIVSDARIVNTDMDNHYEAYDMSKINVPVLIMHAEDDKLADYSKASFWSKKIPDCTFISFKSGGHLMKGNSKKIEEELEKFISESNKDFTIREMKQSEYSMLADFLYEAIFQPDEKNLLPKDVLQKPEMQVYIQNFGKGKDDFCLCAEVMEKVVGAVWVRTIHGYGHVDDSTPEFAISLYKEYRGYGIGTRMMEQMLALLKNRGYRKASLAVQKENYALRMYSQVGFQIMNENEEEYIMEYSF